MARSDRTGNRKMRNRQEVMRVPEMGYYLVVTDTEATERCYFEGLQDSLPDEVKQKLVIKVIETKTQNLIQKCHEMVAYDAHVLKSGCIPISAVCRPSMNHGTVVKSLVSFMRNGLSKNIPNPLKIYTSV